MLRRRAGPLVRWPSRSSRRSGDLQRGEETRRLGIEGWDEGMWLWTEVVSACLLSKKRDQKGNFVLNITILLQSIYSYKGYLFRPLEDFLFLYPIHPSCIAQLMFRKRSLSSSSPTTPLLFCFPSALGTVWRLWLLLSLPSRVSLLSLLPLLSLLWVLRLSPSCSAS